MEPAKAEKLSEDPAKAAVYDATTAKQVLAWQGLRNDAANADYGKHDAAKVEVFVLVLRGFIAIYPA